MARITSIEAQRRGGRVTVFADGVPWAAVHKSVALELGLRRGDEATEELHQRLELADEHARSYESALLLLSYRPRAEHELRERLRRKGFAENSIDRTLERLRGAGLIDDAGFARAWVESRARAGGVGSRRLSAELRRKGVAQETVSELLEGVDDEQGAIAAAASRARSLSGLPYPEFRRRLGGFLQRRGFGYEATSRAIREAWRTQTSREPDQSEE